MDIQSIKKDSAAIAEGQWVDSIPGMGDLRLKVRGSSANYVMAVRARKQRNAPNTDRAPDGSLTRHVDGWPDEEAEAFRFVIRKMDQAYLSHLRPDGEVPDSDNPARDAFRAAMR